MPTADDDSAERGKGRSVGRFLESLAERGARLRAEQDRRAGQRGPEFLEAEALDPDRPAAKDRGGLVDQLRRKGEEQLERKAKQVLTQAFDERRGDLEELGVQTLRRAIAEESERLEQLIERSIEVKKREVRLSLFVLLTGTALYIALALIFG